MGLPGMVRERASIDEGRAQASNTTRTRRATIAGIRSPAADRNIDENPPTTLKELRDFWTYSAEVRADSLSFTRLAHTNDQ